MEFGAIKLRHDCGINKYNFFITLFSSFLYLIPVKTRYLYKILSKHLTISFSHCSKIIHPCSVLFLYQEANFFILFYKHNFFLNAILNLFPNFSFFQNLTGFRYIIHFFEWELYFALLMNLKLIWKLLCFFGGILIDLKIFVTVSFSFHFFFYFSHWLLFGSGAWTFCLIRRK